MISKSGHSRIPIYGQCRDEIIGILLVKTLIQNETSQRNSISSLNLQKPLRIRPDTQLFDILHIFEKGSSHMAIVENDCKAIGIITLEDVIEQLIGEEITDETDNENGSLQALFSMKKSKSMMTFPLWNEDTEPLLHANPIVSRSTRFIGNN